MAVVAEFVVRLGELRGFVVKCMQAVGAKTEHAEPLADLLVSADYRGHYSHGLNRLGKLGIEMCSLTLSRKCRSVYKRYRMHGGLEERVQRNERLVFLD